jgi:pimeloyl-ACP methyl ester carboxylesterase
LSGEAQCDVKVVQVIYESIGVDGEPATLSAGLYIPERCAGPFPLLAQAHGTQSERQSLTTQLGPGDDVIAFFAARGYLVVTTDYLGLGESNFRYHPYLHADSEASAIIDSIRAAKLAAQRLGVSINDQVMLFGYSQGGHAAMAAQREIERNHRDEIRLVAAAPMAGPYSLSMTFLGSWFGVTAGQENTLATGLLAYALVSYNKVYGSLYERPEEVFAERYANDIERLFSGSFDMWDMYKQQLLPPGGQLNELRNPAFTAGFIVDERHPLREALRKNDLLDWTPKTPTVLCGSRRDAIVDFNNTLAAQAAFKAKGVEVPRRTPWICIPLLRESACATLRPDRWTRDSHEQRHLGSEQGVNASCHIPSPSRISIHCLASLAVIFRSVTTRSRNLIRCLTTHCSTARPRANRMHAAIPAAFPWHSSAGPVFMWKTSRDGSSSTAWPARERWR